MWRTFFHYKDSFVQWKDSWMLKVLHGASIKCRLCWLCEWGQWRCRIRKGNLVGCVVLSVARGGDSGDVKLYLLWVWGLRVSRWESVNKALGCVCVFVCVGFPSVAVMFIDCRHHNSVETLSNTDAPGLLLPQRRSDSLWIFSPVLQRCSRYSETDTAAHVSPAVRI